jgi:hypothetical protein
MAMGPIFLDRIDTSPIANNTFDPHFFLQWLWILVDSLNENLGDIENGFNLLTAVGYTQTQITDMETAGQLDDGVLLYDTTNAVYVGRQSGSLVQFTTTAYP